MHDEPTTVVSRMGAEPHSSGSCGKAKVEPASAHSSVLAKDATMGQDGHAFMACAETSRNSFSVAPLAD